MEEKDIQEIKKEIIEKIEDKKVQEKDIQYVEELELLEANDTSYGLSENDLFLVQKEEEKDGKKRVSYDVYDKKGNLIGRTDKDGNIELTEEYKNMLKEKYKDLYKKLGLEKRKIKVENIKKQLDEKKKEEPEKTEEERTMEKSNNGKDDEENKQEEKEEHRENPNTLSPEEQQEKMEKNLGLDSKDIKSSSEIKDPEFYRIVPEAKEYDGKVSIVYIGSTNEFMIVGKDKVTGEYKALETVEASRATQVGEVKKTMDVGRNGNEIKEESLKAIINIKGEQEYSFSAKLEGINPIEFKELRRDLTTGKYMSADLQTTHQYPTNLKVRDMMDGNKNRNIRDEVAKYDERDKKGDKEITIDEIKDKSKDEEVEEVKKDEGFERELYNDEDYNYPGHNHH